MSTGTAVATTEGPKPKSVIAAMATRYGMEPAAFEATVRATCMPQGRDVQPMTREEFAAGIMVAEKYTLNPILREIYFYPRWGGGIVPVVSIDGWLSLINRRKELDGIEFDELHDDKGKLVSITCRIYRTDRKHPTIVTEHLSECWRDTQPWKMPHRMLRHKALIQCARYAFGFAGIHDEDEAERIVDAVAAQQIAGPVAPPPPPPPASGPQEPAPPANTNAGPAAPPAEKVEEAEIVESPSPEPERVAGGMNLPQEETELLVEAGVLKSQQTQHPPLAQEEAFDPEAWLAEVKDRFDEARTPDDVDGVHEVFGCTANDSLGLTDRQKYQDMHEAAVLRTAAQGKPEQAEQTGEPGPAPEEGEAQGDVAEEDEDDSIATDFPGNDAIAAAAPPPPKSEGQIYVERIRAALADQTRTVESIAGLWNATKEDRARLVKDEQISKEEKKALQGEIEARVAAAKGASAAPSAPPAEESEVAKMDREFRADVAACSTMEEIGALVANTMVARNKFSGTAEHKAWTTLVAQRRKQISGVA